MNGIDTFPLNCGYQKQVRPSPNTAGEQIAPGEVEMHQRCAIGEQRKTVKSQFYNI